MFIKIKTLKYCLIFLIVFSGCSSKDSKKLSIQFSKDSSAISISDINAAGYLSLKNEYDKGDSLTGLVSVLEMPGEDDSLSREEDFPGKIIVKDQQVLFIPARPFVKGKRYLVATGINLQFGDVKDAMTNSLNVRGTAQEETLIR